MNRLGFIHCIYRLDKTDILVLFCLVVSIRNLLAQCQGSNNFCSHLLEFLCKTGYAATRSDDVVEEENFLAPEERLVDVERIHLVAILIRSR